MNVTRTFRPETVLFAAFVATLPLYSPSLAVFHDLIDAQDALMAPLTYAMMISTMAAGALMALRTSLRGGDVFLSTPAVVGGGVCYVGGYALLAGVMAVEALGTAPAAALTGVLLALGSTQLCLAWGAHMARHGLRDALFASAVAVGLGAAARHVMSLLATGAGLAVFAALVLTSALVPCVKALRGTLREETSPEDEDIDRITGSQRPERDAALSLERVVQGTKRMAQVAGLPFVGLLVFGYLMGVRKLYVFDVVYIETVSDVVAAVLVALLCLLKIKRPLIPFVYQTLLPACALALLVMSVFPVDSAVKDAAVMGSYVLFSALAILAMGSLCAMAHAREFSPVLIYALSITCFVAVSLVAVLCGTLPLFQDDDGESILAVIDALYFAFLLAVPLWQAWRHEEAEVPEAGGAPGALDLRERCDRAAQACGLTPRETEVLAYLGRGHGIAFVAKTLVVSESTVRTHVKNIYRKLGVSSREELLERIDEGQG